MIFKEKVNEFLNSRKNANNLSELINYLLGNNSSVKKKECLHALEELFLNILPAGSLEIDPNLRVINPNVADVEDKYVEWLTGMYDKTWSLLFSFFKGNDSVLVDQSLLTAMNLLSAEAKLDNKKFTQHFKEILLTMLNHPNGDCIEKLSEYFQHQDVFFYLWKSLREIFSEQKDRSDQFISNTLDLLEKIPLPKSLKNSEEPSLFFFNGSGKEKFTYSLEMSKKCIQRVWMNLINGRLSPTNHRKLLIVLLEGHLSSLKRPTLLTDFFFSSLAVPGATGLLALQGMSILVTKHNLECPNIFGLLYNMFVPDIFYTRYKARLFYQADLFLQSTHISEQLVAAFVKRLSRLSLVAQACDLVLILQFVCNLLIRHPALMVMVHHPTSEPVDGDPYDPEEKDPVKSRAIESSLWELALLKNHVQPKVAAAAQFLDGNIPPLEHDIHQSLDYTYQQLFTYEVKKNPKAEPSLTFTRPSYGIAKLKDDKVYKMWSLT